MLDVAEDAMALRQMPHSHPLSQSVAWQTSGLGGGGLGAGDVGAGGGGSAGDFWQHLQ